MTKKQQKMWHQELPFRLGATSYIFAEDILPNVHKLKNKAADIELILFENDGTGNIPTQNGLKELKHVSDEWGLTYTVHLPLDIGLGNSGGKRSEAVAKVKSLVERLSMLDPHAYILHLNLSKQAEKNLESWQDRVGESLKKIAGFQAVSPQKIAVENLSYPFCYVDTLVGKYGFSTCVDIGHLIVQGVDPLAYLEKYFHMTRVVHLHGVNAGTDHVSLRYLDAALLERVALFLKDHNYRGVVTLEVFSQTDLEESSDALWEIFIYNRWRENKERIAGRGFIAKKEG